MPVIINGSTGITNVNGSASTPAETGTDTDTGIYYGTNTVGLATNGTNALFIDASQNVGIGTSSPAAKLDVRTAAGTAVQQNLYTGSNAASATLQFAQVGAVGWNTGITATTGDFQIDINTGGVGYKIVRNATAIDYHSWLTSGSERMRIDSSGNVGIGTTTFTYTPKLQVNGANVTVAGRYGVQNIMSTDAFAIDKGGSLAFGGKYATDGSYEIFGQISGRKESAGDGAYTGYLAFATGVTMTERMRIDSSGNVGIGTSSPSGRLDVYNATNVTYLNITSGNAASAAVLCLNSGSSSQEAITYQQALRFGTATGVNAAGFTERMRIDSSGNLLFNSGYGSVATAYGCRAWVNFNGTGTVAIRASGNVTSITDLAVGKYIVNLATAMPDANYSAVAMIRADTDYAPTVGQPHEYSAQTSSQLWLKTGSVSAALDSSVVTVAFFR